MGFSIGGGGRGEEQEGEGKASKVGKKGGKGTKGLSIKPPSHAQLKEDNEDLRKMLEEEREKNGKKKKDKAEWRKRKATRGSRKSGSDKTLK